MAKPTAMAPMRTRAMALSLMLTRSAPASRMSSADCSVRSMRTERGGSISTLMTKRPTLSAVARPVGGGAATSSLKARRAVGSRWWPDSTGTATRQCCRSRTQRRSRSRTPQRRRSRQAGAPRRLTVQGLAHGGHVLGRRAAAAAHDLRSGGQEARHLLGEVGGRGGPHELAADAAGQAGVGHDEQGCPGRRSCHLLEHLDAGDGSGPAVDAQGVHPGLA